MTTSDLKLRLAIIYRPLYSLTHPVTTDVFFIEFADNLESVILSSEPLVITGDFNIHVDVVDDRDSIKLLKLLESMALKQHVNTPTHEFGHTLYLIITHSSDSIISSPPKSDHFLSDHSAMLCGLKMVKPPLSVKEVSNRKLKSINIQAFMEDFQASELCQNTPQKLNDIVNSYISTLAFTLNKHGPLMEKTSPSELVYHGLMIASNKPSDKDGEPTGSGEPLVVNVRPNRL